jgi:hypothetical protein
VVGLGYYIWTVGNKRLQLQAARASKTCAFDRVIVSFSPHLTTLFRQLCLFRNANLMVVDSDIHRS